MKYAFPVLSTFLSLVFAGFTVRSPDSTPGFVFGSISCLVACGLYLFFTQDLMSYIEDQFDAEMEKYKMRMESEIDSIRAKNDVKINEKMRDLAMTLANNQKNDGGPF